MFENYYHKINFKIFPTVNLITVSLLTIVNNLMLFLITTKGVEKRIQ